GSPVTASLRGVSQLRCATGEQIQHRHSNGDAIRDLIENHAMRTISHVGIDLDAAVHGTWVEYENVAWCAIQSLARDAEDSIVFAQRRDVAPLHALELQTQNVQRVGPLDPRLDPVEHLDAKLRDCARQQRTRAAHADDGPELLEPPDVRARDSRVQDVAADTDA